MPFQRALYKQRGSGRTGVKRQRSLSNRPTKRPRSFRKTSIKRSIVPSRNVHSYKRYGATVDIDIAVNTAGTGGAITALMSEVINMNEFANLYDRYMLTGVLIKFQLITNPDASVTQNTYPAANTTSTFYPKLWYVKDYDDSSTPTKSELKEYAGVKERVLRPNSEVKIFLKPAILGQLYKTAVTTGYAPKWNQWIDWVDTTVPHYGLKYWIDSPYTLANNANAPMRVRYEMQYFFKCKDVR